MFPCEMCGRKSTLAAADIEGVELKVCNSCAGFGTLKRQPLMPLPVPKEIALMPEFTVVDNYAFLLRAAREKSSLTQEEFARLLQEKASAVTRWEAGAAKPLVDTARRIGKILGLTLVQLEESAPTKTEPVKKSGELTVGDLVKVKRRQ